MADISIALSNIQNIKTVEIQGLGVIRVRRLGAGEELDLSYKVRQLGRLFDKLGRMDFTKYDAKKPEDLKKIKRMSKESEAISDEIMEIQKAEFQIYKKCLTDDKGGAIVDVIMNTLSHQERAELFRQIFGEKKAVESPATTVPEGEDLNATK